MNQPSNSILLLPDLVLQSEETFHSQKKKRIEFSKRDCPREDETKMYALWLKLLYEQQSRLGESHLSHKSENLLRSSCFYVDQMIKRLTIIAKLSAPEWLLAFQLSSRIFDLSEPTASIKYASIFAVSLYIAHKFLIDTAIWFPEEFSDIVGVPQEQLRLMVAKYLEELDYEIPLDIDYDLSELEKQVNQLTQLLRLI